MNREAAASGSDEEPVPGTLREVAILFLKLGTIAFGGPAAHVAMMRDEIVRRRRWMTDQQFLDLLGTTNLIPGPNSTEMAIFVSQRQAGWRGLIVGGSLFILPSMLMVLGLAWAYVRYGSTPEAEWLLYGIKPVIIAIVVQALWALGKAAVKGPLVAAMGIAVLVLYLLGLNEIVLLFGGGFIVMASRFGDRPRLSGISAILPIGVGPVPLATTALASVPAAPFNLGVLFLTFLKIGAVLYGSGYVLLAFLRTNFVEHLGWLTDKQLIDAVAIGQLTPGPVSTAATFVGYLVGGVPGALLATLGIFLPGFIFVAVIHPIVPRLRRSRLTSAFLDGVNVASLGLMAGVTWQLGRAAVVDWYTALLALIAAGLLLRFRLNSAWLVIGGGAAGLAYRILTG
ncbi:chromate efflux transporter [Nitrolancea hollandica]|uniref:Chromate transporter, chromate ion transporter (CHR) family n=1 Tax=Nitrolancea hollandica Lb TaxID=1129897 RepID=I4EDZ0_9BACT|nr:chromate efflux transporter [Nitrolancea hollandica]CCF82902.1 Chromate transporter, chromate ion transporter (CHR) family [Nitrolancea hollandica Lb]